MLSLLQDPRFSGLIHSADELLLKRASFSLFPAGIPQGAISEIYGPHGSGKTSWVLSFLDEQKSGRIAWIEPDIQVYPYSFLQWPHLALNRFLLLRAGKHCLWTARSVLQSRLFRFVVISQLDQAQKKELELRRLQIEAKNAGAFVLLISETPTRQKQNGHWTISLQVPVCSPLK